MAAQCAFFVLIIVGDLDEIRIPVQLRKQVFGFASGDLAKYSSNVPNALRHCYRHGERKMIRDFSEVAKRLCADLHGDSHEVAAAAAPADFPPYAAVSDAVAVSVTQLDDVLWQCADGSWVHDASSSVCQTCNVKFTLFTRRHHCRACASLVCGACSKTKLKLKAREDRARVCTRCLRKAQQMVMSPN
eukprot:TRINITY_DN2907_c1_g3_i1.p1 TRINITY_DN2907_c1_g3~~TRINITY_DN2907_c1_g3_i1.p1  ORF type:complete len:216 (-),score=44.64 TRINITY_DN2907_c1_g3_i1:431-994(-)